MLQTMTVTSALGQNWVGCTVCTSKAQVVPRTRAEHRVAGASCRIAACAVALCRSPPVKIQKLYRDSSPYHVHCASCLASYRACRSAPAPYRRALGAVLWHVSCRVAGHVEHKCRPPATIQIIVSLHTLWPSRAHTHCRSPRVQAGHVVARCWRCREPCRTRYYSVGAPYCVPLRVCALLCHNTVCCIVTRHQKWAVAHPTASCTFFFSLVASLLLLRCNSLDNYNLYNSKILRVKF